MRLSALAEHIENAPLDTQIGFAVRAYCARLLGLQPHAVADAYWNRRNEVADDALADVASGRVQ